MTLYWFLLVVSSLAMGSLPAGAVPLGNCLAATVMIVSAWVVLCFVAGSSARFAIAGGGDERAVATILEFQLDVLRWSGLVVAAVVAVAFGLSPAVKTWPIFEQSMVLQACVLLAPGITITAATWLSERRYGVQMGYENAGSAWAKPMFKSMLGSGGWILLPVFLVLGCNDWLSLVGWSDNATAVALMSIGVVVAVPLLIPLLVQHVWPSRPLAGDELASIQSLLRHVGVRFTKVRVWTTGGKHFNAFVAGMIPGMRSMVLTDRVMTDLTARQRMMIVLHEVAHIRRGHIWVRMFALAPAWAISAALASLIPEGPGAVIASSVVTLAFTLLTLCSVSHVTELDADRWACRRAANLPPEFAGPISLSQAVDDYASVLHRVAGTGASSRSTWLHPSVNTRVEKLRQYAEKMNGRKAIAMPLPSR